MAETDLHELAAPYALDALGDDDRRRFEAHLASCARCRADVEAFQVAATQLAFAGDAPPPPADLRGRILDAARAERSNVVPLRPRRSRGVPVAASLAAVASVAAVAAVAWAVSVSHSLSRERSALRVIGDPAARRLPVRGAHGARGALYVAPSGKAALAVDLSKPPRGKTYEVWVMDPRPHRAGLFSGGTTTLTRRVRAGVAVAVTLEKAEGVDAPTSKALLVVRA